MTRADSVARIYREEITRHRVEMLSEVTQLLLDVKDMRKRIESNWPDRLPTAQLCCDDVIRVYSLLESAPRMTLRIAMEIRSRLVRASLLSEALNVDPQ